MIDHVRWQASKFSDCDYSQGTVVTAVPLAAEYYISIRQWLFSCASLPCNLCDGTESTRMSLMRIGELSYQGLPDGLLVLYLPNASVGRIRPPTSKSTAAANRCAPRSSTPAAHCSINAQRAPNTYTAGEEILHSAIHVWSSYPATRCSLNSADCYCTSATRFSLSTTIPLT